MLYGLCTYVSPSHVHDTTSRDVGYLRLLGKPFVLICLANLLGEKCYTMA